MSLAVTVPITDYGPTGPNSNFCDLRSGFWCRFLESMLQFFPRLACLINSSAILCIQALKVNNFFYQVKIKVNSICSGFSRLVKGMQAEVSYPKTSNKGDKGEGGHKWALT